MAGQMGNPMMGPMAGAMGPPMGAPLGMSAPPSQTASQPTLVGIIQQEEKSKARRRGSPNTGVGNIGAGTFTANGFQPQADTFPNMYNQQRQSFMPQQGFQQGFGQQQAFNPHASMMMPGQMMPGQMMPGQMMPGQMMMGQQMMGGNYIPPQMQALIDQQVQQQVAMQTFRMGLEIGSGGQGSHPNSPRPGTPSQQMPMNQNQQMPGTHMANGGMPRASSAASLHPGQSNGFLDPMQNRHTVNSMPMLPRMSMMSNNNDARSMRGQDMGYAPSLAPSERSNIGQASRYRPVINPMGDGSTGASSVTIQGAQEPGRSRQNSTIRVIDKPKGGTAVGGGDEDDDEGWGILKRKKKGKGKNTPSAINPAFVLT
jgi:hypothetical protein